MRQAWLVSIACAVACSPKPAANGETPLQAAFGAICAQRTACGVSPAADWDNSSCVAYYSDEPAPTFRSADAALLAVAEGKATIDSQAWEACLATIRAQSCGWLTQSDWLSWPPCNAAIKGTQEQGAHCIADEECANGLFCAANGSASECSGTCMRLKSGQCVRDTDCSGTVCFDGTCVPARAPATEGMPCGTSLRCQAGLFCQLTTGGDGACSSLPAAGSHCTDAIGCSEGLHCIGGTCGSGSALGAACQNDFDCGNPTSNRFCDAASERCVAGPKEGPCLNRTSCDFAVAYCDARVIPPTCTPYKRLGEACHGSDECGSPYRSISMQCINSRCDKAASVTCTP